MDELGLKRSNGLFRSFFFAVVLLWGRLALAIEGKSEPEKSDQLKPIFLGSPSFSVEFNDASLITKIFRKNPWFEEFIESNLYRGLVEDLGPVLLITGENLKNAWKGRLIDFLSSQFLKDEPIQIHYFLKENLVSPLSVVIPNVSEKKLKVVSGISDKFLRAPTQQEMLEADQSKHKISFAVRPLHVHSEKFATYQEGSCLAISRDPRVSIASGQYCKARTSESPDDGRLKLRLDQLFPQIWSFASKFYGFENELVLDFKYKLWDKNLRVTKGTLKVREGYTMAKGKVLASLFEVLPAQTVFFATIFTPFPESFDKDGIKTFLGLSREELSKKTPRQVTLAAWNRRGSAKGTTHVTAVLIQDSQVGGVSMESFPNVFSEKALAEIKFDRICDTYIVVTPYLEALEDLRQGCSKSIPVLSHKRPGISDQYDAEDSSTHVYFDLAALLTDSLKIGIDRAQEVNALKSPEVTEVLDLLNRLPAFGFQGIFHEGSLKFEGVL